MNSGNGLLSYPGFTGTGGSGYQAVGLLDCRESLKLKRIRYKGCFIRYTNGGKNLFQAGIGPRFNLNDFGLFFEAIF